MEETKLLRQGNGKDLEDTVKEIMISLWTKNTQVRKRPKSYFLLQV